MHAGPSNNNTNAGAVIPYYAAASMAFLIAALFTLFSQEFFFGHYFQPRLLAITHLLALGWGTMTIFGALHQFVPVLLEVRLYSERIARITFLLMLAGIPGLIYSFWNFEVGWPLQLSSLVVLAGICFFLVNIYKTARAATKWSNAADFITTSALWLFLTASAGVVLVFNFRYLFLPESHLHYLKLHAHLGMVGWFLFLIIGVSSRLVPMFLLSPQPSDKSLTRTYHLVNLGLLGYVANSLLFKIDFLIIISVASLGAGIIVYIVNIRRCYLKRVRKAIDTGMKESLLAFFAVCIPLILLVVILVFTSEEKIITTFYIGYGFSILFGFISTLILGQVYKTLPFIIWLQLKEKNKTTKKLPKDLYSEPLAKYQFVFHLLGVFVTLAGILLKIKIIFIVGSLCIVLSAILFNINVFKMFCQLNPKRK